MFQSNCADKTPYLKVVGICHEKKNVWNYHIHPFTKSCARHHAKPFTFYIFGFYSFFWIFWYITHRSRLFMTWVTSIVLYLERIFCSHGDEWMNEWKFWLGPVLIKNESLINQRTHNQPSWQGGPRMLHRVSKIFLRPWASPSPPPSPKKGYVRLKKKFSKKKKNVQEWLKTKIWECLYWI